MQTGSTYANSGRVAGENQKLDLRQFLPGGARDPARINGGLTANQMAALGIHTRNVDIWSKITERMQVKCKLGELFGCD